MSVFERRAMGIPMFAVSFNCRGSTNGGWEGVRVVENSSNHRATHRSARLASGRAIKLTKLACRRLLGTIKRI